MPSGDFKQGTNLEAFIVSGQVPATTATTIYTVPSSSRVKVASLSLTNVSAAAVTVSVGVVPSGGTADGTHLILSSYSLASNDTISHEDVLAAIKGATLPTGAFLSITAAAANTINYLVTGAVSS